MKPLHDWALKETLYHVADRYERKKNRFAMTINNPISYS